MFFSAGRVCLRTVCLFFSDLERGGVAGQGLAPGSDPDPRGAGDPSLATANGQGHVPGKAVGRFCFSLSYMII